MIDAPQPLAGSPLAPVARTERTGRAPAPAPVPSTPPRELGVELDAAAQAMQTFDRQGISLHFDVVDGAIRIQMLDANGGVMNEIPPGRLLEALASGGAAGLVVDTTS